MFFINTPILVYHRIAPENSSKNLGGFSLPASQFERQMRYLHKHGYVCPPLTELLRHSDDGRSPWRRAVALTFDDGYEDFFTVAYPILRDYGFTATVFLVTNLTRGQSDLEREGNNQYLTWEQIGALQQGGISFGSHTCTHPWLHGLSHEEIKHELTASKECLETRLCQKIDWLAYPHGASTSEIQRMAEAAGYKAAFGIYHGRSGRYNIRRRPCLKDESRLTFALRLSPLYHIVEHLREDTGVRQFLRKVKNRSDYR